MNETWRINRALNKLAKLYRDAKARKLEALGLHPGQDVMLWFIADSPDGLTISALASRIGIEPPTATRSLTRMEALGLFTRQPIPGDRRQVRIKVTDKGRALIAEVERVWGELADQTLAPLPADERELVLSALEAANERLHGSGGGNALAES